MTTALPRTPARPTSPAHLERWSPRALGGEEIPVGIVLGLLEGAFEEVQP